MRETFVVAILLYLAALQTVKVVAWACVAGYMIRRDRKNDQRYKRWQNEA